MSTQSDGKDWLWRIIEWLLLRDSIDSSMRVLYYANRCNSPEIWLTAVDDDTFFLSQVGELPVK